jgi:DNA-binding SARP family transcriptional activator
MLGEYRVLGDVEVLADGVVLDAGSMRQRCVLAALLAEPDRVVTADELADRVWGARVPPTARSTLRGYLSRLRQAMAGLDDCVIIRRTGGYLLAVPRESVDLHRFRAAVARSRAADGDQRLDHLEQALALWRGPAFAGMETPWFTAQRATLDAERREAECEHADLLLERGRHTELLAALTTRAEAHPTDERVHHQLVLALVRGGRHAEALAWYDRLAERRGAEPGPALRALRDQIRATTPVSPQQYERHELGQTVVARRRRLGWTQEELAEHTGLSVRTVRDLESGRVRVPRRSSVRLLADAFGLQGAERDQFFWHADATPSDEAGVTPAQLPAALPALTGRDAELAHLDTMAGGIAAVYGTAGVGKTALVVHWAHRAAARFPHGQLYVNLRGYDPAGEPMSPAEAVRGFLDALGVAPERIPPSLDAQAALYRSLLDGRRVLVVLDNARDADQVRVLLPGTPTALTLVTSRNQLTSLVAVDGARPLDVRVLDADRARDLLTGRLGAPRVDEEPHAVDHIVARCAGLPLALTIAAARAAQSGFPLAAVAEDLRGGQHYLDALDTGDPAGQVRAVFSWSYRSLTPAPARLFRLLGLPPGADISARAAASLAGTPPTETRRLLAELTRASLLTEHVPGRYAPHDLLRAYAADLAATHDPPDERRAAVRRWLDHLLHTAHRATTLVRPHQAMIELAPSPPGVEPETPADSAEAMAWLQAEYATLTAAVGHSERAELLEYVWPLAWAVEHYAHRRAHWDDLPALFQAAIRSTGLLGDVVGRAGAHRGLARAYVWLARFDDAQREYHEALRLFTDLDDLVAQARVHHGLAELFERSGDYAAALGHTEEALALYRGADDVPGQARALNAIGWCHCQLAQPDPAVTACEEALWLLRRVGDRVEEAATWDSLGYAQQLAGRHDDAVDSYRRSIELCREQGDRYHVAEVSTRLADAYVAAGQPTLARSAWRQALTILDALGHPTAEQVRTRLRDDEAAHAEPPSAAPPRSDSG